MGNLELLRVAACADHAVERVNNVLKGSRLPQKKKLQKFIADLRKTSIEARTRRYLERSAKYPPTSTTIRAFALGLGQVEDAFFELHDALAWSLENIGFQWWISKRLDELGVETQVLVLTSPGSARDFFIERQSAITEALLGVQKMLKIPENLIRKSAQIRVLTVPQRDGTDAKWHPISLGHELAHLKFDYDWLVDWLRSLGNIPDGGSDTRSQNLVGQMALTAERLADSRAIPDWFRPTCDWLMETACDAAANFYYGDYGLQAMHSFLSVHPHAKDSTSHPSTDMRLWALGASPQQDMQAATGLDALMEKQQLTYLASARLMVDKVNETLSLSLGDDFSAVRERVRIDAAQQMKKGRPPLSAQWDLAAVMQSPSAIEAGLTGALWMEKAKNAKGGSRSIRVQHAVDFLQFQHRLWNRIGVISKVPEFADLTNALLVTRDGVKVRNEDTGLPAMDVRLGRYFIIFKRNVAVSLNAVGGTESARIQQVVEVGWGEKFVLQPNEMVLGVTLESLIMDDDVHAQVLSRSSLGRMGLLSATAVHVQPGFRGCLTLELVNLASIPLEITPGQRIAQIVPQRSCGSHSYNGRYQDQDWKPRASEVLKDEELQFIVGLEG